MALPNPFSAKAAEPARYLTIALSDTKVQALFWQVDVQPELIQASSVKSYTTTDKVSVIVDQALQELGKESEHVNDVVFALEPSWVTPTDVESSYKPLLKHLSEELGLNPMGYVVFSESLIKKMITDQPHTSLLLIYITEHTSFVEVVYRGVSAATQKVGRSSNPVADVTEALARIAHAQPELVLPSQMMVASQELEPTQLEELQQALLNNDWTPQGFTHPPTIELVSRETLQLAIISQAGSAIGEAPIMADDQDKHPKTTASSFGVPVAVQSPPVIEPGETAVDVPTHTHKMPAAAIPMVPLIDDDEPPKHKKARFPFLDKFKTQFHHHKKFMLLGFGAGLLALLLVGYVGLVFGTTAAVALTLKTKPLSKEVTITVDPSLTASDPDSLILAAQSVTKQVSGSKTVDTTGVKLVGEKAQGKVTIFNKTDSVKTFEAGTKVSSGKLTFTLDQTVQVASASVKVDTSGESKEYGKADVAVTATDIGADYNLASKTELTVATFDSNTYSATVADALTGGSSRETRVVSDSDRQNLLKDLKQELIDQANKELAQDATDGKSVVPTQTAKVDSAKFSDEVGKEVSSLTLDATVTATALSYNISDLQPLAQHVLQADIPEGFKLSTDQPQLLTSPDDSASKSGKVALKANVSSKAVPDLNIDQLKGQMEGHTIAQVEEAFTHQDAISAIHIQLNPAIAMRLRPQLPKDPAKIQIQLIQ